MKPGPARTTLAPAREAAFQALRAIDARQADLGDALSRSRDPLPDARDRALATDLVTGTLRWRGAIDYQLARLTSKPLTRLDAPVVDALRLGAYQLLHLERVPVSAAVHDSVELVKRARLTSAAAFVNGVLRRLARERAALTWPARPVADADRAQLAIHLAVVESHPAWLVERWLDRLGVEETEIWLRFNNQPAVLTLAANRLRLDREALAARLQADGFASEPTPFAPAGLRVDDARVLTTATFREGDAVVQDEASQLVAEVVRAEPGMRVLDACAAPGGKTLALASQVGRDGLVAATDVRARRVHLLASTMARTSADRVRIVHIADRGGFPFADGVFDRVLVDAPCSGLGTVRRDPDIRWRRTADDLPRLAQAQTDLLDSVAPLVAPGGRLIYSTCSSEPEENEAVVGRFLSAHPDFTVVPLTALESLPAPFAALASPAGHMRTTPAQGLEAFFAAVMQRRH